MTDDEIKLIANKHGASRPTRNAPLYVDADSQVFAFAEEVTRDDDTTPVPRKEVVWRLSNSGAFRVLVEMMQSSNDPHIRVADDGDWYWDVGYASTPHEAIAMARLAQLQ